MSGDLLNSKTPARVVDGREMQPPEPLERTLEALDKIQAGEEVLLLVYCHPVPLFNILRNNGYAWQENVREDGTHEILIRHA